MHVKSFYYFRSSTNACVVPLIRLDRLRERGILFREFIATFFLHPSRKGIVPCLRLLFVSCQNTRVWRLLCLTLNFVSDNWRTNRYYFESFFVLMQRTFLPFAISRLRNNRWLVRTMFLHRCLNYSSIHWLLYCGYELFVGISSVRRQFPPPPSMLQGTALCLELNG
jgi:hypothetical protein